MQLDVVVKLNLKGAWPILVPNAQILMCKMTLGLYNRENKYFNN